MSDAAEASTTELETEPDGRRFVHFVDTKCWGCGSVTVGWVPADLREWRRESAFFKDCHTCGPATPHDIRAFLTAMNRSHDLAIPREKLEIEGEN